MAALYFEIGYDYFLGLPFISLFNTHFTIDATYEYSEQLIAGLNKRASKPLNRGLFDEVINIRVCVLDFK
jgi:hypothetical protein